MTTTIEPPPSRATRGPRLPDSWLRASLAGIEAALLGWLVVVVPAVAAYVATAAVAMLGDASWVDAAGAGTALWLVGHGGLLVADGTVVSLMPLGLTLLGFALVYGATRRARVDAWAPAGFTVAGYVIATLGLSAVVPGPAGRWQVLLVATGIAAAGALLALRRTRAAVPLLWGRIRGATPGYVRAGVRGAGWATAALLTLATAVVVVALVRGIVKILDLHEALEPGVLGTVALVLLQLLYLPTAVVWGLAWLTGPGFAVGTGTLVSPAEVITAPMPALPMLGALPEPGSPGLGWVVIVPVLVGAVLGWVLHRRRHQARWWQAGVAGLTLGAGAGLLTAVLMLAGSGAIGPGRMSEVGKSGAKRS